MATPVATGLTRDDLDADAEGSLSRRHEHRRGGWFTSPVLPGMELELDDLLGRPARAD
jgi:hypothetical protein